MFLIFINFKNLTAIFISPFVILFECIDITSNTNADILRKIPIIKHPIKTPFIFFILKPKFINANDIVTICMQLKLIKNVNVEFATDMFSFFKTSHNASASPETPSKR